MQDTALETGQETTVELLFRFVVHIVSSLAFSFFSFFFSRSIPSTMLFIHSSPSTISSKKAGDKAKFLLIKLNRQRPVHAQHEKTHSSRPPASPSSSPIERIRLVPRLPLDEGIMVGCFGGNHDGVLIVNKSCVFLTRHSEKMNLFYSGSTLRTPCLHPEVPHP